LCFSLYLCQKKLKQKTNPMKTLKIITGILCMLFFLLQTNSTLAQTSNKVGELITIKVYFHCPGGKAALEQKLPQHDGIFSAKADLQTKDVVIDYDPVVFNKEKLVAAIEEIGYLTEFSEKDKKLQGSCAGSH
jgi:copper chaperone CopZ